MSVFDSKTTLFHCFSPKNHCLAQFGQDLSGDPDGGDAVAFISSSFLCYFIV